jgi:hypothetical protein
MSKRSVWFQKNTQQGVFMKIAAIPTLNKNGPTQVLTDNKKPKSPDDKYFVVGKSKVGGEEVIGG